MSYISVGLKYYTLPYPVRFYLGAGGLVAYLNSHVSSKYLHSKTAWGGGAALKSGLLFTINKAFLIDLFADYYFMYFDLHSHHKRRVYTHGANTSGWYWGGALGYSF